MNRGEFEMPKIDKHTQAELNLFDKDDLWDGVPMRLLLKVMDYISPDDEITSETIGNLAEVLGAALSCGDRKRITRALYKLTEDIEYVAKDKQ
jgi:hypothetical protein